MVALLLLLLAGCVNQAQRVAAQAEAFGFERVVAPGLEYLHVTYIKHLPDAAPTLHVYIENDGVPWLGRYAAADDPTPRRPLMLELMALDSAPAVYVGRPCYFGTAHLAPCMPLVWTHERYSEAVVGSMAAVIRRTLLARRVARLVLFGHSGGGTLAVLLAERFSETVAIVTLAGNLDVQSWVRLHGYAPLRGSLDPATRPPLAASIVQQHYVGSRDRNVTPAILRRYVDKYPAAILFEIPGFDHECCWLALWPQILKNLETGAAR